MIKEPKMNTGNGLRFLHIGLLKRMRLTAIVLALGVVLLSTGTVWAQADETTPEGTYIVQRGDSWTSIAERNGLTVGELKAANPQSIRANDWLNLGEEINIPTGDDESPDNGDLDEVDSDGDAAEVTVHIVGGGESWNSIANLYDVAVSELIAANPQAVRDGEVLFRGDELAIPQDGPEVPDDVGIDESDMTDEEPVAEEEPATGEGDEDPASDVAASEPEIVPEQSIEPESETDPESEKVLVDEATMEDATTEDASSEDEMAEASAVDEGPETYT
jgi:LysM repeat protein